ncbi:MAG: hypothetical protein ACXACP_10505 [Candidatus Hodarchaeales archaeon]|jgi:hypothetical protein
MTEMLKCAVCDHTESIPNHCGQAMHLETVDSKEQLVCWMGPGCGKQDIPVHHEKSMKIVSKEI